MKDNNQLDIKKIAKDIDSLKREVKQLKEHMLPLGAIQAFAMDKAPAGWVVCDGKEVLISKYKELYEVIGNTFGGDEARKTFCVPDLRGVFVRGWDMDGDVDPERSFGAYQDDALQGHGHEVNMSAFEIEENGDHGHKTSYASWTAGTWGSDTSIYEVRPYSYGPAKYTDSSGTSYDGKHTHKVKLKSDFIKNVFSSKYGQVKCDVETRPKNVALLYCIKFK